MKAKNVLNRIIIWSGDNYNSLGLLRQLQGDGRHIFFLMWGKPTGCASASKYFGEHEMVESIEDGYRFLLTHFTDEPVKPVLFIESDEIIEFIDQHKQELEVHYIVPGTKEAGLLTKIDDKNNMSELARKHGFLVPDSKVCKWDSDISDVKYPCIIKPAHTTAGHYNEFKFIICENEKKLQNALSYVRHTSEFIVQQYIPKEKDALVYGCRLLDGKVLIAGTIVRDRFCRTGETSHGLVTGYLPDGVLPKHIEAFLAEIDYCGLFSFEYGLFDEKAYFFEVNLRNDGTSHFFYQAGANIPLAWYYSVIGFESSSVSTKVGRDSWYIDEIYDEANVWNGNISRKQWRQEKEEASVYKYYDPEDVGPWKSMKKHRVRKVLQDWIVKRFRIYIVWIIDKFKR